MNKDFAFVLGNGITRLEVDCESLLDYGTVYGCNRIYQEFAPHVLVSTDQGMCEEIQISGYSKSNCHYVREQWQIGYSGAKVIPHPYHGYSSGPAALGIASLSAANYLFLIGFDFKGTNNKINNIYAGTEHYKEKTSDPIFFGNWVDHIDGIVKQFSHKRFMQINPLDCFTPEKLLTNINFEALSLSEFKLMINNL